MPSKKTEVDKLYNNLITFFNWDYKDYENNIREVLKDSLTSLLDSLENKTLDHMEKLNNYAKENEDEYETVNEAHFAYSQLK